MRTSDCDKAVRLGRLSKAEQFADAARTVRDLSAGHLHPERLCAPVAGWPPTEGAEPRLIDLLP